MSDHENWDGEKYFCYVEMMKDQNQPTARRGKTGAPKTWSPQKKRLAIALVGIVLIEMIVMWILGVR